HLGIGPAAIAVDDRRFVPEHVRAPLQEAERRQMRAVDLGWVHRLAFNTWPTAAGSRQPAQPAFWINSEMIDRVPSWRSYHSSANLVCAPGVTAMIDKTISLPEAIADVVDGARVALGGNTLHRGPCAAVHEIVRQRKRGLEIVKTAGAYDVDLLAGT